MSVDVTDLSDLNVDDVQQESALLAAAVQDMVPTIDVKRGVINDLVIGLGAILGTKNQVEQDRLRRSSSVSEIEADPTLADDDVVNKIASNYRVTRVDGAQASGRATVVVSSLSDITIAVGSVFSSKGKSFTTPSAFTGRVNSASVTTATDNVLIARGDGTYEFQINLTANDVGIASQLPKDSSLTPAILPPNFVAAFASEDFTGGLDAETSADLLERFVHGMSAKVLSGRDNMSSLLREQFPLVAADSIIGFGDAEMHRDRHSIFPVSMGGRVDWYVRSQVNCQTVAATRIATLVDVATDGFGIWQMAFTRDEYPGLYDIEVQPKQSAQPVSGGFTITSFVRDFDISAADCCDGFVPDVITATEAAFSRFQTVTIEFKDTIVAAANLVPGTDTADYNISVRMMPQIDAIQDYMTQRGVRNAAGDVLVKAPIPCFTGLSMTLALLPGQPTPDTDAITDALVKFVNSYGFAWKLPSSGLLDVIHNYLPPKASVTRLDIVGHVLYPDGNTRVLFSSEALELPNNPVSMVTGRTVAFYLRAEDVAISVVTAEDADV